MIFLLKSCRQPSSDCGLRWRDKVQSPHQAPSRLFHRQLSSSATKGRRRNGKPSCVFWPLGRGRQGTAQGRCARVECWDEWGNRGGSDCGRGGHRAKRGDGRVRTMIAEGEGSMEEEDGRKEEEEKGQTRGRAKWVAVDWMMLYRRRWGCRWTSAVAQ